MRRDDICIYVSPCNRARLVALVGDRNTSSKVVWRAEIVLATADGHGTNEIMRRTGKSKPCVWRWQERYIEEGVEGLMRDKTRPSRKPPLSKKTVARVVELTLRSPPGEVTHWTASDGQGCGHFCKFGAAHLAQPRPCTPPVPAVQAVERPQIR